MHSGILVNGKRDDTGLVLEGDDARAFQKYAMDPSFTRECLDLLREAKRDAERFMLD
jgi:hypothetical protein